MSYSKLFKPYLKSNVLCGNFGTVQVKKLQDMITAEELTTFVAMQFEQRLNNLLRSFPIQDVGKEESELRKQVCSFCEAVVTEQQHPDSEFSTVSSEVATMVIDLLSIGNVVALQRGAATLNNLNQQQSSSSVVAFFTKHKVGQLLTQASAEVMVEGAARVAVEKAMQDTSAALAVVKELPKAGEEELSGVVAVYLEKSKLAGQEIAAMKKQGTHMARTTSKCANDLDQMAREFWAWLNKALRSELSNTARGVLEESAALLGPEQASVDQFSIQDVEHVLKCKEVVKHAVWDRLSAELEKEKKSWSCLTSTQRSRSRLQIWSSLRCPHSPERNACFKAPPCLQSLVQRHCVGSKTSPTNWTKFSRSRTFPAPAVGRSCWRLWMKSCKTKSQLGLKPWVCWSMTLWLAGQKLPKQD